MPLGQDWAAYVEWLWGNCRFSSSLSYLLFLPFHFLFSSAAIPVIRLCCSCFQSGWTQAINTWDNPTAVSNWISLFFFRKALQLLTWNPKRIWKSNSFLTDAHSCFLDETPFPQSNESCMQLIQNSSLRLWLFPAWCFLSRFTRRRRSQLHIYSNC